MKMLQYGNALKLIEEGGFGFYRLYSLPGQEPVGTSHSGEDSVSQKYSAKDLIDDLNRKIELLGDGQYMIHLKKAQQSQDGSKIVMRFEVGSGNSKPNQDASFATMLATLQNSQLGSMSGDKVEEIIQRRVAEALAAEREKAEIKDQLKEVLFKLKEVEANKRRRPVKNQLGFLNGIVDIAKIGALTFIAERYPNAIETVKEGLKTMRVAEEDEEEEEEETTGFKRPEE